MRLYYNLGFKNEGINQNGCCLDAIAFTTKDGQRISMDVAGWNDYELDEKNKTYSGRVKWDHDIEILNLDIDKDYEDISDEEFMKLIDEPTDIEICAGYYDKNNNDIYTDLYITDYDITFSFGDTDIEFKSK